ncbi:IS110 family transposase [Flavobacterium sp. H122]|uniref:IS110 family transposase n=1 Tax=Flavobacterium sp. H122 TaxID=2529860 RepID=UPI0010AA596C|nr:IS110 family transposase [Flavobacterium sp. H122]
MDKNKKIFGIDISKETFDVVDSQGNYYQFSNNFKSFLKFLKLLDENSHCVMEATGYYHYSLACFLVEKGIAVSVENPLSVKRFIQMHLSRIKTDKSDAAMICLYGQQRLLSLWEGYSKNQLESLQLIGLLETYTKQSTALKNKLEDQQTLGNPSNLVLKSLKKNLMHLQKEMVLIEQELLVLVKQEHQQMLTQLESIPGVGRKTAMLLVVLSDGFRRFENSSQLCSFTGLTPMIRQSGSSVKGKNRISKMGNGRLRNLLFMCSFTACKCNKGCRELYERLVNQGKSKKLVLIAVCNKLLKQAFAIAKSGVLYNENHRSKLQITS